jgi:hypothetical protein
MCLTENIIIRMPDGNPHRLKIGLIVGYSVNSTQFWSITTGLRKW